MQLSETSDRVMNLHNAIQPVVTEITYQNNERARRCEAATEYMPLVASSRIVSSYARSTYERCNDRL